MHAGSRWRRIAAAGGAFIAVIAIGGCSVETAPVSSQDCQVSLKVAGVVYTSYGFTDQPAVEHATAELAQCMDVGDDGAGSAFPASPHLVRTWRFAGHSPRQVLGARLGESDDLAVFVAESVPQAAREQIYAQLRSGRGVAGSGS